MDFYSGSLFLLFFTFAFIAMDEFIAKPVRRRRLEARRDKDPLVKRALDIAEMVEKRDREHEAAEAAKKK